MDGCVCGCVHVPMFVYTFVLIFFFFGLGVSECARHVASWVRNRLIVECDLHKSNGLFYAITTNEVELVTHLLNLACDTDLDAVTCMGETALIRAASLGREEVVEILCDRGAKVNFETQAGTYVHVCVYFW